jgi:hypothetical protein
MGETRGVYRVLVGKPEGKRPRSGGIILTRLFGELGVSRNVEIERN